MGGDDGEADDEHDLLDVRFYAQTKGPATYQESTISSEAC